VLYPRTPTNSTLPATSPIVITEHPYAHQTSPGMAAENGHLQAPSDSPTRRSIRRVEQTPPVLSKEFASNKPIPHLQKPEMRLQDSPSSPVNISPPRPDIQQPESAAITQASGADYRFPTQVQTPDSAYLKDSSSSLPYRSRPGSGQAHYKEDASHSRTSSSAGNLKSDGYKDDAQNGEVEQLQYSAFGESPSKKKQQVRSSQATVRSTGSSSGSDHKLQVPGIIPRPTSTYSIGANSRGRSGTPLSVYDSDLGNGSPNLRPRDVSSARRSPGLRPTSYIDLLNEVPYHQQVAPGGMMNNAGLQSVVGNAASLLDTKKTLDMYRQNIKKTNDAAVQYEFAIFMMNAALNNQPGEDNVDSAQLILEAKHILQRLADRAYPFAQYYLGDGYFSGVFNKDKPDYDKAFPLFIAASKHGHAEAGYRAALCYEFGWGTSKSYPKAVQFYRNSASKNHPGAATRLGMACLKGDMGLGKSAQRSREGMTWLKRATESADGQYNSAPFEIGLLHLHGSGDDVFKDESYAAQLITQAAELGHVKANFLMGQAYENGLYGCPRDAALSVHFYNGAASRGMPEAMMALCAWYMVGAEPVLEKDEGEACAWAKQAADLGKLKCPLATTINTLILTFNHRHAQSRIRRGLLHRNGHRVPARPTGSKRLLRARCRKR
jgi:TPR repeat protein